MRLRIKSFNKNYNFLMTKILIINDRIEEQVSQFDYLGYNLGVLLQNCRYATVQV